jgi:hypothetical protein
MDTPARQPELKPKPCPFCGAELELWQLSSGPFWEHPVKEPCVVRGIGVAVEGLPMWNRRAGEAD